MFWEEEKDENTRYVVPDDVVDLVYSINCKCLPLDHAYTFSNAVRAALPWMDDEPQAGNPTSGECQHVILEDTEPVQS